MALNAKTNPIIIRNFITLGKEKLKFWLKYKFTSKHINRNINKNNILFLKLISIFLVIKPNAKKIKIKILAKLIAKFPIKKVIG